MERDKKKDRKRDLESVCSNLVVPNLSLNSFKFH